MGNVHIVRQEKLSGCFLVIRVTLFKPNMTSIGKGGYMYKDVYDGNLVII